MLVETICSDMGSLWYRTRGAKRYVILTIGAIIIVVFFGKCDKSHLNSTNETEILRLPQNHHKKKQLQLPITNTCITDNKHADKVGSILKLQAKTNVFLNVTSFIRNFVHNNNKKVKDLDSLDSSYRSTAPQGKLTKKMTTRPFSKSIVPVFPEKKMLINLNEFIAMVTRKADKHRTIILSTVDFAFVEMAINLYRTSLKRFNLTNYLFVCSHATAKEALAKEGIDAVQLWNDTAGKHPSDFATTDFNRKTRYKTMAATLALDMGYSVLVLDVDIVFFKDPFPYLKCNRCDIIMQSEGNRYYRNTGFYLALPTQYTIKLHHMVLSTYRGSLLFNDQQSMNTLIIYLEKQSKMQVKVLDQERFPNGDFYFDQGKRMFADDKPSPQCVLVHNNYIASYSNKQYRFKEHLMWKIDSKQYYSNPNAKYLMYDNCFDFGAQNTTEMEEAALITAFSLGYLLERIVILPRFYCYQCPVALCLKKHSVPRCAAYVHFNMSSMDKIFTNKYRENVFLHNEMVPPNVKSSISDMIFISSKIMNQQHFSKNLNLNEVKHRFIPADLELGMSHEELEKWLEPFKNYSVLKFHSLYGKILDYENLIDFQYTVNLGIRSLHTKKQKPSLMN